MKTILEQILSHKRQEIEARQKSVPVEMLKDRIATLDRPRNFFSAVTRKPDPKPLNLIAELKKASPSAGVIREDYDVALLAREFAAAGADAISIATDEKFYQGKLEEIATVRAAVNLPVLRRDFLIDLYQIYESRAAGADAVLLISEILRTDQLIDLQILATELNLTCLIEVHDMDDLMRVRDHVIGFPHRSYSLIGINNRDLNTFKTDIRTTLRLLELIEDKNVLVSDDGINSREDVQRLAAEGVRAVLIGESILRSDDIAAAVRGLLS